MLSVVNTVAMRIYCDQHSYLFLPLCCSCLSLTVLVFHV